MVMETNRTATMMVVAAMGFLMLAAGMATPVAADHASSKATFVTSTNGFTCIYNEEMDSVGEGGCVVTCPPGPTCTIRVDDVFWGTGYFVSQCTDGSQSAHTGPGLDRTFTTQCPDRHVEVYVDFGGTVGTIEAF